MTGLCAAHTFVMLRNIPTTSQIMLRCRLSHLMFRDKLRISDVVRETGLNRSTVTALYKESATRVELPAIDRLCNLFHCQVGDLFEHLPDTAEATQ